MLKQNLKRLFDWIRDNNDTGSRTYRVAEGIAPQTLGQAPVDDTDIALFNGQMVIVGTDCYQAFNVTDTTTTWKQLTYVV